MISLWELLAIVFVAIVVLKPEQISDGLHYLGRVSGWLQQSQGQLQKIMDDKLKHATLATHQEKAAKADNTYAQGTQHQGEQHDI